MYRVRTLAVHLGVDYDVRPNKMARRAKQTEFAFRTWGGKRKGAGPKPGPGGPRLRHVRRPAFPGDKQPLHVTLRVRKHVPSLRKGKCFAVIRRSLEAARERLGMRVCHFAVLGNHVHLVVEATDKKALGRAMKGLGVRIARRLNRAMQTKGAVLADRYHARALATPVEVKNVVRYLLENARRHGLHRGPAPDTHTSLAWPELTAAPRTWLLDIGWLHARQRAGPAS